MSRVRERWESMDKSEVHLDKLMLQFEAVNRADGKTPKTVESSGTIAPCISSLGSSARTGFPGVSKTSTLSSFVATSSIFRRVPGMRAIHTYHHRRWDFRLLA